LSLSIYSKNLDSNIDDFTRKVKNEISQFMDMSEAIETGDRETIDHALLNTHGVLSHLITEYRRIKERYNEAKQLFEMSENACLISARQELNSKATEREVKQHAYDQHEEALYARRTIVERLETRYKYIGDHVDLMKIAISAMQTACNSLKSDWSNSQ